MKIKQLLLPVFFTFSFVFGSFFLTPVIAQDKSALDGLNESAEAVTAFQNQANNDETYYDNFLQTKAGQIIGTVLSFVGVLFLILMIYAGILWMTAQGNDQQVSKAKGLLINGIIGLIIVFAAYAITSFIGGEILG